MEFTIEKTAFLKMLGHGQGVVEKRSTVPILSHVMIDARENEITLTSTDLDMALVETMQTKVFEEGCACVPAHLLYDIVKKLNNNTLLRFKREGESEVVISSGRSVFRLPFMAPSEFPVLSQQEMPASFLIESQVLLDLFSKCRFAMSTEDTRFHLNGVYLHPAKDNNGKAVLRSVATDMHRLACVGVDFPEIETTLPSVIIGRKAVQEISKILDEVKGEVDIAISENRIEVTAHRPDHVITLSSRLIDATYPDYQTPLSPKDHKIIEVDAALFTQAIDRISTVMNDKDKSLKIRINTEGTAKISAVGGAMGSAFEELDIKSDVSEPFEVCFNGRYLFDISSQIQSEKIELLMGDQNTPTLIRPANTQGDEIYLIMPLVG